MADAQQVPRVSVILPCLNEARYIRAALESILGGTFPAHQMEVIVVDGGSQDGTRDILLELSRRDNRVRVLHNPRRLTPIALNIGIRAARGQIVLRVDAHSVFPENYVAQLVLVLEETGADMVGGCLAHVAADESLMSEAIAIVTGSPFGTGSPFRYRRTSGPVDAVAFGCWRREIFDRVGLFDERLLRNQDNEHSSRILRAGGLVYMTDDVTIHYHPRSSLRGLWRQAWLNGTWNAFTEWLYPYTFRFRHFLPGVFCLGVLFSLCLLLAGAVRDVRFLWAGAACLAPYLMVNLISSIGLGWSRQRRWRLLLLLPLVFFSYHFVYGAGIVVGWSLVLTGMWRDRPGSAQEKAVTS